MIIADNVLKPGSPLFLWRLTHGNEYDNHVVRVREFAMPAEDWMSVSVLRPETAQRFESASADETHDETIGIRSGRKRLHTAPEYPEELVQLQWESDRIRAQATRTGSGSVTFGEWSSYADKMKDRMAQYGIVETIDAEDL